MLNCINPNVKYSVSETLFKLLDRGPCLKRRECSGLTWCMDEFPEDSHSPGREIKSMIEWSLRSGSQPVEEEVETGY